VSLCVSGSDDDGAEPQAKQAKLDENADLSGGLKTMLKTKLTEVCMCV